MMEMESLSVLDRRLDLIQIDSPDTQFLFHVPLGNKYMINNAYYVLQT